MDVFKIVLGYWVAVNVAAFVAYGVDKWKSMHKRWRIPEATLLILAAVGGSLGAWLGMYVWHHKTKHKKFKYGVPLILAAQVALVVVLLLSSCGSRRLAAGAGEAQERVAVADKGRGRRCRGKRARRGGLVGRGGGYAHASHSSATNRG